MVAPTSGANCLLRNTGTYLLYFTMYSKMLYFSDIKRNPGHENDEM